MLERAQAEHVGAQQRPREVAGEDDARVHAGEQIAQAAQKQMPGRALRVGSDNDHHGPPIGAVIAGVQAGARVEPLLELLAGHRRSIPAGSSVTPTATPSGSRSVQRPSWN